MARRDDPEDVDPRPSDSFAARLKRKYGEGVDPEVSLDDGAAPAQERTPRSASSELLRRLADHSLKESRYTLQGEIARGGMGAILKVWDEDLRRTLAMKVILGKADARGAAPAGSPAHGDAAGGTPAVDTRTLGRFLEEAQVTGQLDHPGIAPVHELGLDSDGRVYFTMKLVKGRDLKHIFDLVFEAKEGWNETRALSVILKVCEAMAYAHTKGVIHRDLKPANVMVGNFGEVYVMDWGLARVLGRKDSHDTRLEPEFTTSLQSVQTGRREEREAASDSPLVTMDGDVVGTPAYMAPEQARGEIEKLSARSDVYALGAMLYHLLARQMPYVPRGARVSNRTVLGMVLQGPPAALASLRKDVPAELLAICEKAMSREASARYPDTLALAEDLRAYLEHRVVGAYETGTWAETKKWVQRNKPLAASLAAGVLALAAGLIVSASLTKKNRALFVLAEDGRVRAEANERAAKANEAEAKREKSNVLRLSAFQTLDDLTNEADSLWPAEPSMVERYRAWLERAEKLVAKIPEFKESLVEIEQRALPQTDAERAAQRTSHPRWRELEQKTAQHVWLSRMLGEAAWPSESSLEAELALESLPADANALNALAWALVDPETPVYGSEVKALLLARRAVAASSDAEQAANRDTLAWALFKLARFDEALAEEHRALADAGAARRVKFEGYVAKLETAVQRWQGEARTEREKERASAAGESASLEAEITKRSDWRFAKEDDRWWHAQMEKLVAALEAFADAESGLMRGISAESGWGMARRLDFAASIEERSVSGTDARKRWAEAIEAIAASDRYRDVHWRSGARLTPQLGLVPIGVDPVSGLWEFAHLQTGDPAVRGAGGKLGVTEQTGVVLVLIPGGKFAMGAQKSDPAAPNYDPQAIAEESPVHDVTLSPYFLSKYELTQGQWLRITARNPSQYGPSSVFNGHQHDLTHPVEQVTWTECMETLERIGLSLPSEAQWEFGCRGGTDTPWWLGAERESLRGHVNLADRTAARAGAPWQDIKDWPDLDDGWVVHAPVGSLAANPYGLNEVHGNVWEWCRDGYGNYSAGAQQDPVAHSTGARSRVNRGGSFSDAAAHARSAIRINDAPEYRNGTLGVRPAREFTP